MSEHPINDDELMMVDDRLRTEAEAWRRDPPVDLHERTMSVLTPAHGEAPVAAPSARIGRIPHGMALAAACLALLITTWAALVLESPPARVVPDVNGGDASGGTAMTPGGHEPAFNAPPETTAPPSAPPPLSDLLAQASLEGEMTALQSDARTLSTMMTRQVRLISGQER